MTQQTSARTVHQRSQQNASAVPRPVQMPKSTLINRNIMVAQRRTSVRLEPEMWAALLDIARRENETIHTIATMVADNKKPETSLTAAIRVFCLAYYRSAVEGQ